MKSLNHKCTFLHGFAFYFCMFLFLSVESELGGVAVVHCLPKKKEEKKRNVAFPSLQTFQGWLN